MSKHLYSTYVYMEDTGGYVYHANYLKFAERARTEMLRAQGIDQRFLHDSKSMFFVVQECKIVYLQPACLDDFLEIETHIHEVTGVRLIMVQKILRNHVEITNLFVTLVLVNEGGWPLRIPAFLRNALVAPERIINE